MITNRKFIVAFAICFLLYLLPEIFASDAMLYITGGIFAGTISQILKVVFNNPESNLTFLIWGVLLVIMIYVSFKLKNHLIKYVLLFTIGLLLYLIDFALYSSVSYDAEVTGRIIIDSAFKKVAFMLLCVLLKSTALAWIYYKGIREE